MLDRREIIFSKVFLNEISVDRGRSAERVELEFFHDLEHSCCLELLNIRLPLLITGVPYDEHKKRIEAILEKVDLSQKINDKAGKLSGGEKQRCAIARALVCDPPLILADEPCGNLDSENSLKIMNLLKSINEEGKGVILITHDKEAAHYAKRIVELKDGRIINEIS